tara:strand:+ start:3182 stop:3469 length:288 start_codon:yes stop_codon:yes gene_type:complete
MAKRAKKDDLSLTINFDLPVYEPEGYERQQVHGAATFHADMQIGASHAEALFRLREELRSKRVILNNRPVWTTTDTIRWLIEMVAVNCAKQDNTK